MLSGDFRVTYQKGFNAKTFSSRADSYSWGRMGTERTSSKREAPPSLEPTKMPWRKVAALIVVSAIVVGGIAVYLAFQASTRSPVNRPPTIQTVSADKGAVDIYQQVSFTAMGMDPVGDTLTNEWVFGYNMRP